jgi:hypothetical protein
MNKYTAVLGLASIICSTVVARADNIVTLNPDYMMEFTGSVSIGDDPNHPVGEAVSAFFDVFAAYSISDYPWLLDFGDNFVSDAWFTIGSVTMPRSDVVALSGWVGTGSLVIDFQAPCLPDYSTVNTCQMYVGNNEGGTFSEPAGSVTWSGSWQRVTENPHDVPEPNPLWIIGLALPVLSLARSRR